MMEPRSVRFEPLTLARLSAYAARHPGLSGSSAAALLVEEGLRMDEHPGIVFRDGPTGRRAVLIGGPDVWEVVRSLRDARAAEPQLGPDELVGLVSVNSGVREPLIRAALDYFGAFPDEVNAMVAAADGAEAELERAMSRTRELLGS